MKVGIVGVGLIGGSLARALAESGVRLWLDDHDPAVIEAARRAGLGTVAPVDEWAGSIDMVVFSVPLSVMARTLEDVVPKLRPDAWVVDVSSVKRPIQGALLRAGQRVQVLSMHLMAGREISGFSGSTAALFRESPAAVVDVGLPLPPSHLVSWWQKHLATKPFTLWTMDEHDSAVAWISQLSYLLSWTLRTVVEREAPEALSLAGPGYRDTARVGHTEVQAIAPMLFSNAAELKRALLACESELRQWRASLDRPMEGDGDCHTDRGRERA